MVEEEALKTTTKRKGCNTQQRAAKQRRTSVSTMEVTAAHPAASTACPASQQATARGELTPQSSPTKAIALTPIAEGSQEHDIATTPPGPSATAAAVSGAAQKQAAPDEDGETLPRFELVRRPLQPLSALGSGQPVPATRSASATANHAQDENVPPQQGGEWGLSVVTAVQLCTCQTFCCVPCHTPCVLL